jgi:hypothetical protein
LGVAAALTFVNVDTALFANQTTLDLLASAVAGSVTAMMQTQEAAGVVVAPTYVVITQVQDLNSQVVMYVGGRAGTPSATMSPSVSGTSAAGGRRRMQVAGAPGAPAIVQMSYVVLLPPSTSANRTAYLRGLIQAPLDGSQTAPAGFSLFTATVIQNVQSSAAAAGLPGLGSAFAGAAVLVAVPAYRESLRRARSPSARSLVLPEGVLS